MVTEGTEQSPLYSVRMHASAEMRHLCGAERIVRKELLRVVTAGMVDRVLGSGGEGFDAISIRADAVDPASIRKIPLLPIQTLNTSDPEWAENEAVRLLTSAGVSRYAARRALKAIASGPSPRGGNMRGSMILHAEKGDRLEPDPERGVRVSRMDLTEEAREDLWRLLEKYQIRHPRVLEAVVLASKVTAVPGVIAEVCRSDDPDYTTGYVASPKYGYVRLPQMKEKGDRMGGRALFVEDVQSLPDIIEELENTPYLIHEINNP